MQFPPILWLSGLESADSSTARQEVALDDHPSPQPLFPAPAWFFRTLVDSSLPGRTRLWNRAGIAEARESALQSCPEHIPSPASALGISVSSFRALPSAVAALPCTHGALFFPLPPSSSGYCVNIGNIGVWGDEVCVDDGEFWKGKLAWWPRDMIL